MVCQLSTKVNYSPGAANPAHAAVLSAAVSAFQVAPFVPKINNQ